jgi:hypothetical protein
MKVGVAAELANEVAERRDAPVARIGAEAGDDEADPHGLASLTTKSV